MNKQWSRLGFSYSARGHCETLYFLGFKLWMRAGVCRYLLGYSWVADYD